MHVNEKHNMKALSRISNWYFSRSAMPFWLIFIIDCAVVFLSALMVHALNNGTLYTLEHFGEVCGTIGIYLIFFIVGFRIFHTYAGVLRYSSFIDLQRIALAILLAISLSAIFKYVYANENLFPMRMRDILTWSVVSLFAMWFIRIIVKYWFDTVYTINEAKPIFIYGVKQGGVALAKSIRNQKPSKYVLEGFVTSDPDLPSYTLMGVRVYLETDKLVEKMKKKNIYALFVSPMASSVLRDNKTLIDEILQADIKIFMMNEEQEWNSNTTLHHEQLREVAIEDLLPRASIQVNMEEIGQQLKDKKIMITGAAGSIGGEMVVQIARFQPAEMILIDQAETPLHDLRLLMSKKFPSINSFTILSDISNRKRMADIFALHRPEYIFHAAAYKHVPMMEDNPSESIQNNVIGTRNIADLAVEYGAKKFVMVSTDKAVNPTNVMGCSKRICEIYVQSLDKAIKEGRVKGSTQFVTTRFGNVLGSNGSVIPLFREQIKNGGPVTVTHPDIIRYFMLISEACKLVLEAGTMGNGGEIYVFDMGMPVKIVDLARHMIKLSGADIEIKFTGLRNGEKLYEEVLNDKEKTLPTPHPKIQVAKVREYDYFEVNHRVNEMEAVAKTGDDMEIVRRMKQMVPEYKSQHSIYERLDREISNL